MSVKYHAAECGLWPAGWGWCRATAAGFRAPIMIAGHHATAAGIGAEWTILDEV
jgi:hypothetical protein